MIFKRIAYLVVVAVVLVNGAPLDKKEDKEPTLEEAQKLLEAVQEIAKFGIELKKVPGLKDLDLQNCISMEESKCIETVMKAFTTLFKKGYKPWSIPKIDPLKIADFETTLATAKYTFKNVELTGFDTMKLILPEESDDESIYTSEPDNYTVDLTVKGKLKLSYTVSNQEHTFETQFVKLYPNINIVVNDSCEKFAWRFQECSKNYKINYTFNGTPINTLSNNGFMNDIAYQEWYNQNVDAINKQKDDLLKKFVKEFIDAVNGVFFKMQKKFENSVNGEKIDYFVSFIDKL